MIALIMNKHASADSSPPVGKSESPVVEVTVEPQFTMLRPVSAEELSRSPQPRMN